MDSKVVIVVGAGPAGIATAIQLKRSGVEPLLIEKHEVGGLLLNASLVENYPGFPKGINGRDLVDLFKEQLKRTGVRVEFEEVLTLDYAEDSFSIETDQRTREAKIIVVATGTRPKKIPGLEIHNDVRDRILYEINPIREEKRKNILIIGSGDAAFDYALGLSQYNKITILNRSDRTRCLPILMDRCMKSRNISYSIHTEVNGLKRDGSLLEVAIVHIPDKKEYTVYADYLIVATGREPCTDILSTKTEKNLQFLKENRRLFMIGDVINGIYRQTAISVGDGIRAAMEINGVLRRDIYENHREGGKG